MSKIICASAIDGAVEWVAKAEAMLGRAVKEKGESAKIGFPDTAYFLPIIHSITGEKPESISDLRKILNAAKELLPPRPSDEVWLPYLGSALDAGIAALFACEIIEACKYLIGPSPVSGIWLGAASDIILRERGIEFVDGTAPGFAAITGAAPTNEIAVKIARELQEKNIYVFMAGSTGGKQFAEQLEESGIQLGWETRLVPFGADVSAIAYALGFANRVALSFGGVKAGDYTANFKYSKNRIFAFVLAFGGVDASKYALAAGAINYGFPVIADTDIPQILPTGICTYEHVVSSVPYESMVERALEVRGCKIKIDKVPIPVPYGPAFEGERIRKTDAHAEFGGNITRAFEYVTMAGMDQIEDGKIEIVGKDIDEVGPGSALPLAIWVEVAGRKMQTDFESILERQIHHLLNGAEGVWHMGQRDIVWTRISKDAFAKGFRLRHYGEIIHAKFLSNFPAIVDKVKVTLITDENEVEKRVAIARKVYQERNLRLKSMTDESVDTFYSCLLCQSFAPNHVCIITPERLGLCGAYNWLDGKAAFEIDQTGPNQPVKKGESIDPRLGMFKDVNEYVYANSHKKIGKISLYSIIDNPMTSCGCFEVICAYVPECNGVMVVNREHTGDTPAGMTFSSLAGMVGGGAQTPGFMGCGKAYLVSKKFLYADGGHARLVWMPKMLKEELGDMLKSVFDETGLPGLFDKIADESVSTDPEKIRVFMEKAGHPALAMSDMAESVSREIEAEAAQEKVPVPAPSKDSFADMPKGAGMDFIKSQLAPLMEKEIREDVAKEIAGEIVKVLSERFLGGKVPAQAGIEPAVPYSSRAKKDIMPSDTSVKEIKTGDAISSIKSFTIRKEPCSQPVHRVLLGAEKAQGGTRALSIGGSTAMPFHFWEGEIARPLVALEVFDTVSPKYPPVLADFWGDLIKKPAEMAKVCVHNYAADLICVSLESNHPEKGNRSPDDCLKTVKSVLSTVNVPLIIKGHGHYENMNELMKLVASGCAGENLTLAWVEQENYRTIAGAALAYGHTVVAQSPIDVNLAKQLNILLTGMNVGIDRIVIDPMTGALGYGLEYCYSVMERIRLTGLGGDPMLAGPMIVNPGQECAKIKELRAAESTMPAWGDLPKRAALWELSTALSLMYAGADILVMYNPDSADALKKTIVKTRDSYLR